MQDIIDGFLKFQRNAFPKRAGLFKDLANQQTLVRCSSPAPTAAWCRSWSPSVSRAICL